jgi:hypothetical protein
MKKHYYIREYMLTVRAFYSAPSDLRIPNTGGPIVVGSTAIVEPPLKLCVRGLHASRNVLDALIYRSDGLLTVVDVDSEIIHDVANRMALEAAGLSTKVVE